MTDVVDVLHERPRACLDEQALQQTLTFAFATGGGSDAFARLFSRVQLAPSEYDATCFSHDLFLETFVDRCLASRGEDAVPFQRAPLLKLISAPPTSMEDVHLRQEIFRELLDSPELVKGCSLAWARIQELRCQLESAEIGKRSNAIARRLEILRSVSALPDVLEMVFGDCHSSLARIAAFARSQADLAAFGNLRALIDHDDHLASLDLRVRIGREGQIRHLAILHATENVLNPLHRSAVRRLWGRIVALFRGYSIYEREVLGRLVEGVFDGVAPFIGSVLQLGLQLEFYIAFCALAEKARCHELAMSLPRLYGPDDSGQTHLQQLFNPFLMLDGQVPVPCDVDMGESCVVLLTGPNSGGKTRLLQALGLAQLLAQCGAPVPARMAVLRHRTGMFVSLVHGASANQREGRLGTELMRIRRLFERLGPHELVLLDELCSGTNPSEGEEIVELVIDLLDQLQPQAWISTHFLQFASRLEKAPVTSSLRFLQVALDEQQRPLYQFEPGVATTSLAAQTAERLGVTREALEALIAEKRARAGADSDATFEPKRRQRSG